MGPVEKEKKQAKKDRESFAAGNRHTGPAVPSDKNKEQVQPGPVKQDPVLQADGSVVVGDPSEKQFVNFDMIDDGIMVSPVESEKKTKAGLIIPESASKKSQLGIVVAVGDGRTENGILIPMKIKVGNMVLFGRFKGNEVWFNESHFFHMFEGDVMAVVSGNFKLNPEVI